MLNSSTRMFSHKCHKPVDEWVLDNPPTVDSYEFERFELSSASNFYENYWHFCFYFGGLYVVFIVCLQNWMKTKQAYELKTPLFLWNLSLGIFSVVASLRSTPTLLHVLQRDNGFYISICVRKGLNYVNVFWGFMFLLSKILEFGDTVFLILRKKPLHFIHWYHHLTTMLVSWIVAPYFEPINRWFAAVNYFIHSFMYPYFALKAIGLHVPRFVATTITIMQFFQMLLGVGLNITSYYLQRNGCYCDRKLESVIAFFALYGSFAILFGVLLYQSLIKLKNTSKRKTF